MSKKEIQVEGWVSVFKSGTDYEADIVRDRLDSAGVPAAVFTQRDHAFSLTIGALARVYVMVPEERVDEAKAVLAEQVTDEELEAAAEGAEPSTEKPGPRPEEPLDSGIEKIHFSAPEEPPEDDLA